jgi:hypothetical protein
MTVLFSVFPAMVPKDFFVEIDGTGLKLNWGCKEPKNSSAVLCALRKRSVLESVSNVAFVPRELSL